MVDTTYVARGEWASLNMRWIISDEGIHPSLLYIAGSHLLGRKNNYLARKAAEAYPHKIIEHEATHVMEFLAPGDRKKAILDQIMFHLVDGADYEDLVPTLGTTEDAVTPGRAFQKRPLRSYSLNSSTTSPDPLDFGKERLIPLAGMQSMVIDHRWIALFQWGRPGSEYVIDLPWHERVGIWGEEEATQMDNPPKWLRGPSQSDFKAVSKLSPGGVANLLHTYHEHGKNKLAWKMLHLAYDASFEDQVRAVRALITSSPATQRTLWAKFPYIRVNPEAFIKVRSQMAVLALYHMPWVVVKELDTPEVRSMILLGANKHETHIVRNCMVDHEMRPGRDITGQATGNGQPGHTRWQAPDPFDVRDQCRKFLQELQGLPDAEGRLDDWARRYLRLSFDPKPIGNVGVPHPLLEL